MSDRIIDVKTVNQSGSVTEQGFSVLDGVINPMPISNWYYSSQPITSFAHKRTPTGGEVKPEREKPFLNSSVKVDATRGTIWSQVEETRAYKWQGDLMSIVCGMNGINNRDNLIMGMNYPMHGEPQLVCPWASNAGAVSVNPDLLSQAEVKCLNKLRDKSGQADLDFGLWFGERKETAQLFAQGAVGILRLAQAIAKKNPAESARVLKDVFGVASSPKRERQRMARVERYLRREARNAPRTAARTLRGVEDAVLGYNLGVSPLLNDIQSAHQRLLTGDLTSKMAVKAVSRHSRQTQGEDPHNWRFKSFSVDANTTFAETHGYTVTLVALPIHSQRADMARLGLANPLNTLYQLTGLTFIVDYFLALGPYLESLTVPLEFEFVDGSWTQRIVRVVKFTVTSSLGTKAVGGWNQNHTQRRIYTKFPVPIPPLSLRGKDLSAKQTVNAGLIALKSFRQLVGLR